MQRVLIVDDDPTFCLMLKRFLERKSYEAEEVLTAKSCIRLMKEKTFDIILMDYRLPDLDGLELLKEIRSIDLKIPVILMTNYANIRTAVKAIQMGAFEYLAKPINPEEMLLTMENALRALEKEETLIPSHAAAGTVTTPQPKIIVGKNSFEFIQGNGSKAAEISRYIDLVAPTQLSVIIEGESGTGKEYVSRMIHQKSQRANKPFVAIDCGALSDELAGSELFGHLKGSFTGAIADKTGQFQAANGGTLFLDEIGNLSYEIQVKLLRAIQEGMVRKLGSNKDEPVDVRIIAATNEDLALAAQQGDFREDLYHRLNEFKMKVPPLRERREDIPLFAQFFLDKANLELKKEVLGFDEAVMRIFFAYQWPGNLREFKNVVRRAVLLTAGSLVMPETLPQEIREPMAHSEPLGSIQAESPGSPTTDLKEMIEKNERETILRTLEQVKYNKSKAARLLNIDRKTLYNKLKLYDIDA